MKATALRALADMLDGAARLARAAADEGSTDPDEQLPEHEAARVAAVSLRKLRDARRAGDLVMYGGQRSRTVRRADLVAWIESRCVRPVEGPDDPDMRARFARHERARTSKGRR